MKKQIKFQKILFIVTLIVAALTLVYGFSYCTNSLTYLFAARSGMNNVPLKRNPVNADAVYSFVMGQKYLSSENRWVKSGIGFNDLLVILGVIFVVVAALQFFFASHNRRNYYVTNYISIGILVVFGIVIAAIAFWGIAKTENLFNQVDFAKYKEIYEINVNAPPEEVGIGWNKYSDSHTMFTLGYVVFSVVLVNIVLLVLNTVWKVLLMKGEKTLLSKKLDMNIAEVDNGQEIAKV